MKDCVSLEIAKKLKEAGWAQEPVSDFYYAVGKSSGVANLRTEMFAKHEEPYYHFFCAPTIGELLGALPAFKVNGYVLGKNGDGKSYWAESKDLADGREVTVHSPNPADALALLWLALREKGIV